MMLRLSQRAMGQAPGLMGAIVTQVRGVQGRFRALQLLSENCQQPGFKFKRFQI